MGRGVDWVALAIAAGLHAAALALLAMLSVPAAPLPPRSVEVTAIPVDLELALESIARQGGRPAPAGPLPAVADVAVVMRSSSGSDPWRTTKRAPMEPPTEGSTETEGAGSPEEPRAEHSGAPGSRPQLSLEQLGVGGRMSPRLVLSPLGKTKLAAAEQRLRRALQQPVAERNAELGIGPHGPVVLALETATRRLATPLNGNALFLVRLDAQGRIVHLSVLEASRDHPAWSRVAAQAQQGLGSRRLPLANGASGMTLRIAVASREQLPSGADPGPGVSIAGIPVKRGRGPRSPQLDILKPELKLDVEEVPNPGGGEPLKLPQVRVGLNLLGVGIDPADVGRHPRRVVHAHVVDIETD